MSPFVPLQRMPPGSGLETKRSGFLRNRASKWKVARLTEEEVHAPRQNAGMVEDEEPEFRAAVI
jgi:hypothetical protein